MGFATALYSIACEANAGSWLTPSAGDELTTSVAAGYSSKRGAGALAEGGAAEGGDACEPFEPPVKYMQDSQASNPARRGAR